MSAPQSGSTPPGTYSYRAPPPRKRPAWRTTLWAGVAVLAFVGAAFLLTPHDGSSQAGHGPGGRGRTGQGGSGAPGGPGGGRRPPTVVGVATVQKGDIPIELTELGTVTPLANVTVLPRIAGALVRVEFKEGQMVRAGQLLAVIDDRPYQAALTQAEGQLLKDQAALANAKLDLARYTTLAQQDSIAQQQVDTQGALVKQDEGVVKTDQAAVASARLNVSYCHITAPVSGRVGLRQVDPGNYVTSSATTGIVIVTQIDPMDVAFSLPEDAVPQVMARVRAGATLAATALDRSGANVLAQGQLLTLDNQIDTSTGTVKAKARFANGTGALYPSQFVNIRLLVDTVKDAVVAPTQAVRHGSQGDYVYTIDLDQNAKMTPVKVGQVAGERTQILSGLQAGDQVVTDGGDRLRDGAPVMLPGDVPALQRASRPEPKPGFFGWLAGLFGKKPAADQVAASGGASQGGQPASANGSASPGAGMSGGYGGGHGGGARIQALVDTLSLSPEQKEKARPIFSEMRQKMMAAGDQEARRAAMKDSMAQFEAILTPEQKARFEAERAKMRNGGGAGGPAPAQEASLPPASSSSSAPAAPQAPPAAPPSGGQGGGPGGRFAMMADALNLDADQRAKAQGFFAAAREKAQGSSEPDARRAAMREAMTQLETILRPDQKAKLAEMRAHMGGQGGGAQQP